MSAFSLAMAVACNKADEGGDSKSKSEPETVAAAEDQALSGHVFLRLKDVPDGLLMDHFDVHHIDLALDRTEYYYLGVGPRVLVVDRSKDEPYLRLIEFPTSLALLGIHEDQLILLGQDPARCSEERPKLGMPSSVCASVFVRSLEEEGPPKLVAAFDTDDAVLAGDHVAALVDENTLMTLPLTGGEPRRVTFDGFASSDLRVQGDRLIWISVVGEDAASQKSRIYRSQAPFDEIQLAFELEKPFEAQAISDVAWINDGFAYLVGEPSGNAVEQKLYRRIGEQTELLMTGLESGAHLVHDSGAAWLVDSRMEVQGLWRISPKEHRRVTFETPPKFVTGTRWGLAWIEEHDGVASFHLSGSGPAKLLAPEVPAEIISSPARPSEGFGGGSTAKPSAEPTVDGDLEPSIVKRIIRAHTAEIRTCSEAAAKKNPELAGEITVAFVIAKTGKVGKAEVVGEPFDAALGKCVTKAVKSWTFPKPGDGEPVDVSHPFAFPVPGSPSGAQ